MTLSLPIVLTPAGLVPLDPQVLRDELVAEAETMSPGLTTDLPGTLIEDIASTDVGALVVADSARVDLINSVTPYGANELILNQLGQQAGVPQGQGSNAVVFVVFSSNTPGLLVNKGFVVSDGQRQYVVQDGGAVGTDGDTAPLSCLCTTAGVFPVPAATVTAIITPPPSPATLTCTNPTPGLPAVAVQTVDQYRATVLQAGAATAQGMPGYVKTQLARVVGVEQRLVSMPISGSGYVVVVGGGDPYHVAGGIYLGCSNPANLKGSVLGVVAITNANPGVVTTDLQHGYPTGEVVTITRAIGIAGINGVPLTITVLTPRTFSIGIDTTSSGAYAGGGELSPNLRNESVAVLDAPDTYDIPFVSPLQERATVSLLWGTNSTNLVSDAAVASLAAQPIADYMNSVVTGQPINLLQLDDVFKQAVASVLDPSQVTRLVWAVTIGGASAPPTSGTDIIPTDPFSYVQCFVSDVTVAQG